MSSTRTAKDDSVFHQGRYASNPEFERGLLGNLVAKRVALLDSREDRELIWAVHFLSHQDGGLAAVARDLLGCYSDRIGTPTMVNSKKTAPQNFSADEIRQIRLQIPANLRHKFPLKGELKSEIRELCTKFDRLASDAERARAHREAWENDLADALSYKDIVTGEDEERQKQDREEALKHPPNYPVAALRGLCIGAAENGLEARGDYPATRNLERTLNEMCLNPEWDFEAGGWWYFRNLVKTLRDYLSGWTAKNTGSVETALGRIVANEFDYTWQSRCMSLLTGEARRGKSFAAKNCCLKNPGKARFVEVPPGNDDTSFFRALARGLGLGNFLRYKAIEIRERVESVLLSGDLLLVLDESQRLWPQRDPRYAGNPSRVEWLMSIANAKVPILMISTPQFVNSQMLAEKTGWNSAQLTGRIFNYKVLPSDLTDADLTAVCRAVLPEASEHVLRVLATYARTSARYLAAIESISLRARYLAGRAGRAESNAEDVRAAMNESVIPSDTRLNAVLEKARVESPRRRTRATPLPEAPKAAMLEIARNRMAGDATQNVPSIRANFTEFVSA